ncbi:MAG: hypothetical protein IKU90_02015 [Clostridia bacterium]|nr:hypothetical protein [Clostridia bacterium]
MRVFFACLTAVCLLFLLSSCTPPAPRDPFAYAAAPFSLTVEGTYLPAGDAEGTPRPFAARISAGAPVDGDPTLRDLTVTFTAPDTLAGLTVIATLSPAPEGTVTRRVTFTYPSDYGQVSFTAEGGELDGFLRYAEAWLPIGDVTAVSPKAPDGSHTVTSQTAEREAVFTFVEGEAFPVAVRLTDGRGVVEMRMRAEKQ